jgi:hypothetical protein
MAVSVVILLTVYHYMHARYTQIESDGNLSKVNILGIYFDDRPDLSRVNFKL